jgi:hypothetical protein
MEPMSGNKGEWSEAYVFLRLLADGKLFAADDKLNRLEKMFFPVLRIIREEKRGQNFDYVTAPPEIRIYLNGIEALSIPSAEFGRIANSLFCSIQSITNKERKLTIGEIEDFLRYIGFNKLKAPSTEKADIKMEIHDVYTGIERIVGFSIKSDVGAPPTIFNASEATNFIYEVNGLSTYDVIQINSINSDNSPNMIIDRMGEIIKRGGHLQLIRPKSPVFERNLSFIDSQMVKIIDRMLEGFYFYGIARCTELVDYVAECNPVYQDRAFYEHNIKEFLCAVALGMRAAKLWDGRDEANGGYVVVKANGDVVAFHIYNRDYFKEYLIKNTRLEKGSTSKHKFAEIYEVVSPIDNRIEYRINLNLQIRFI